MGNVLRVLSSCLGSALEHQGQGHGSILKPSLETGGLAALARDLLHFETTGQVPEGLSNYVTSTKRTQAGWYGKLLAAWKAERPPPRNAHEASNFVVATLHGHRKVDVQGILLFYNLTQEAPAAPVPSAAVNSHAPVVPHSHPHILTDSWPPGVQYQLRTLPVDRKAVADGDTVTVYVDINDDTREKALIPNNILEAIAERRAARKVHDYVTADALEKNILKAGYKIFDSKGGGDVVAHKYRVRFRGVDAPESSMPYGQQAKAMLLSLVEEQRLSLLVYAMDQYGRIVADVYSNRGFIQEILLKKGCAWHYTAYDSRPEMAKWEQQARAARLGLWAASNPQKPWEYRKEHKK